MGPDDTDDVNVIAEYLDINTKHIAHILLPDYTEVIGEVVIDEDADTLVDAVLLLYPIKLQKVTSINNDTLEESSALVRWSNINKDPWTYISKGSIISFGPVTNDDMMDLYLDAVLHAYYDAEAFYKDNDVEDTEEEFVSSIDYKDDSSSANDNVIKFPNKT